MIRTALVYLIADACIGKLFNSVAIMLGAALPAFSTGMKYSTVVTFNRTRPSGSEKGELWVYHDVDIICRESERHHGTTRGDGVTITAMTCARYTLFVNEAAAIACYNRVCTGIRGIRYDEYHVEKINMYGITGWSIREDLGLIYGDSLYTSEVIFAK